MIYSTDIAIAAMPRIVNARVLPVLIPDCCSASTAIISVNNPSIKPTAPVGASVIPSNAAHRACINPVRFIL